MRKIPRGVGLKYDCGLIRPPKIGPQPWRWFIAQPATTSAVLAANGPDLARFPCPISLAGAQLLPTSPTVPNDSDQFRLGAGAHRAAAAPRNPGPASAEYRLGPPQASSTAGSASTTGRWAGEAGRGVRQEHAARARKLFVDLRTGQTVSVIDTTPVSPSCRVSSLCSCLQLHLREAPGRRNARLAGLPPAARLPRRGAEIVGPDNLRSA